MDGGGKGSGSPAARETEGIAGEITTSRVAAGARDGRAGVLAAISVAARAPSARLGEARTTEGCAISAGTGWRSGGAGAGPGGEGATMIGLAFGGGADVDV
jgi:hypothetical protein